MPEDRELGYDAALRSDESTSNVWGTQDNHGHATVTESGEITYLRDNDGTDNKDGTVYVDDTKGINLLDNSDD